MDIRETVISSLFFHLILLLVVAAVASHTTSGGLQNIVSVDLSREDSKDLSAAGIDTTGKLPAVSSPPSDAEASLPEQAAKNPPEESERIPEPEGKSEAINPPAPTGGFASLEDYHRFVMLHEQIFGQQAGARVNELLSEAFKVNTREFYGGTAIVYLKFGADGRLSHVVVDSASPELKAFLEEVRWDAVPPPATYSLPATGVHLKFTVLEGYLSFNIDTL